MSEMGDRATIAWTGLALQDLRDLREHTSRDNPAAARALAARIRERVEQLQDFPKLGRVVPELSPRGYREVIVAPYRIVYDVRGRTVVVLRVWHGRRDLNDVQPESGNER